MCTHTHTLAHLLLLLPCVASALPCTVAACCSETDPSNLCTLGPLTPWSLCPFIPVPGTAVLFHFCLPHPFPVSQASVRHLSLVTDGGQRHLALTELQRVKRALEGQVAALNAQSREVGVGCAGGVGVSGTVGVGASGTVGVGAWVCGGVESEVHGVATQRIPGRTRLRLRLLLLPPWSDVCVTMRAMDCGCTWTVCGVGGCLCRGDTLCCSGANQRALLGGGGHLE